MKFLADFAAIFFLLASATTGAQGDAIGCFVDGECVGGELLTIETHIPDYNACSETCHNYNGCLYFTYHPVRTHLPNHIVSAALAPKIATFSDQ